MINIGEVILEEIKEACLFSNTVTQETTEYPKI